MTQFVGDVQAAGAKPQQMQPPTEAPTKLHAEMEQRQSEALTHMDYHQGELTRWQAVARATAAALESLNGPQAGDPERF